jgi:aspartate kinase
MAGLIVQKYGGTSVGTPERIQAVADRIALARERGHSLVVVVSAMGHTTDELIDLAHRVSKTPPHREMDMLLTAGERISMALLSMALADRKIPALSFTGSQTGIITNGAHRRARIRRILGDRVREAVATGHVAIVAGFQGVSEAKEITTLGRGGSDTTAVALAAALKAECCEIYTDVDGVYSADPRKVVQAKLWKELPHDLMVELATRGAGVLHPRSVELARQFAVPLWVKNSLKAGWTDAGTKIVDRETIQMSKQHGMEEMRVAGVTSDSAKVWLKVGLSRPSVLASFFTAAAEQSLQIVAAQFIDGQVRAFIEQESVSEWKKVLSNLAAQGFVLSFEVSEDWVPVSVVGDRFSQDGTALQRVCEVLSSAGIDVGTGSGSALAITLAVPRSRADEAVSALHSALVES